MNFLSHFHRQNGISPTIDEMREGLGLRSKSAVHALIQRLVEKGYLIKKPRSSRGLEISKLPDCTVIGEASKLMSPHMPYMQSSEAARGECFLIPLFDYNPQGTNIKILETTDKTLWFSNCFLPEGSIQHRSFFGVQVNCATLSGEGFTRGDILVMKKDSAPRVGKVGAVIVDDKIIYLGKIRERGESIIIGNVDDSAPSLYRRHRIKFYARPISFIRQLG